MRRITLLKPTLSALMTALFVMALLVVPPSTPADAAGSTSNGPGANTNYPRMSATYKGVPLRVRGHLNDACLVADAACNAFTSGIFRKEATAQAKVIRHLSGEGPPLSTVQWEVAPDADGVCAPNPVTTPASDNNIENLDPPAPTSSAPPACRFRVDVMVVDGSGNLSILEVKRWRGPATAFRVDTQLTGYVTKSGSIGLNFSRNATLNAAKWSRAYTDGRTNADGTSNNYCVWADRNSTTHAGNIYFAPYANTPGEVRDGSDGGSGCGRASTPTIDPEQQDLVVPCDASWTVTVPEIANARLRFSYGDGTENGPPYPLIPSDGHPTATMDLSHSYVPGGYTQTATPVDSNTVALGSSANSSVTCTEPQPELQPAAATATAGVGNLTTATMQEDPTRSLTEIVNFGDGSVSDTETLPAGDDLLTLTYLHTYATAGTYTLRATIVETGVTSTSTTTVSQPTC